MHFYTLINERDKNLTPPVSTSAFGWSFALYEVTNDYDIALLI